MVVQLPNSAGRGGEIERGQADTVVLITRAAERQGSDRATALILAWQEANIPLTDVHLPLKTFLGYKLMFWDTLLALSAHET
jgi:hypothetical protein